MAKKFMYVCLGVLALAIAYHLGVQVQIAQSQPGERAVLMAAGDTRVYVMTDTGKIYECHDQSPPGIWSHWLTWTGNPPTLTQPTTWGKVKAEWGE